MSTVYTVAEYMRANPKASVEEMMKALNIGNKNSAYQLRSLARKKFGMKPKKPMGRPAKATTHKEAKPTGSKLDPINDLRERYNEAVKLVDSYSQRQREMELEMSSDAETIVKMKDEMRELLAVTEYLEARVSELTVKAAMYKIALKSLSGSEEPIEL
jgi:hypothetical protein